MLKKSKDCLKMVLAIALVLGMCGLSALSYAEEGMLTLVLESTQQPAQPEALSQEPEQVDQIPAQPVAPAQETPAVAEPEPTPEPTKAPTVYYTVTFLDCYGEKLHSVKLEKGTKIEAPKLYPTIEGYEFVHWYDVNVSFAKFEFDTAIAKNIILAPFIRLIPDPESEQPPAEIQPDEQETPPNGLLILRETESGGMSYEEFVAWVLAEKEKNSNQEEADEPEEDADKPEEDDALSLAQTELPEEQIPEENPEEPTPDAPAAPVAPPANRNVFITTNVGGEVSVGDMITLSAVLQGFEGATYTITWQYDDGSGWKDAQEGGLTYSFPLDASNYAWNWRAVVTVTAEPQAPETPAA